MEMHILLVWQFVPDNMACNISVAFTNSMSTKSLTTSICKEMP
jgi:hypothetical protein